MVCTLNRKRQEEILFPFPLFVQFFQFVCSTYKSFYDIKTVASLLGHLEETDEAYYHYDNSEEIVKIEASNTLYSNLMI